MKDGLYIGRSIFRIGLEGFVVKAYEQISAVSVVESESRFDDLGGTFGDRGINPLLDLALKSFAWSIDKRLDLIFIKNHRLSLLLPPRS